MVGPQIRQETNSRRKRTSASFFVGVFIAFGLGLALNGASAATLSFGFSNNPATRLEPITVRIVVDAQGKSINAAESTVTFPASLVDVSGVSKAGIFDHWPVEPTINNVQGKVTFAGGLPTPGFNGSGGVVLTLTVNPISVGSGQFCFSNSQVLLNDGNGTNDLTNAPCATLVVAEGKTPNAPTISSTTHPNQSSWYNRADGTINWTTDPGVDGFSYIFDQQISTVPDDTAEGITDSLDFSAPTDGVWYLHVKAHNIYGWGEAAHFAVHIDTVVPELSISLVGENPTTNQTPDIAYSATDALSGIDHIELSIDGTTVRNLSLNVTEITLPTLAVGTHTIVLRAFDKAGNSTQQTLQITINQASVIQKVITNITKTITNITKTITNIATQVIPEPVKKIVNDLKNNPQVVDNTKNVVQPVTRVAAVVGLASLFASLPLTLFNGIINFIYLILSPFLLRRKRKQWGTVVDSLTGNPIKGVIVRIFETEFNKLKESQITDEYGRFGFLIEPGNYTIMAVKSGFTFPSKMYSHLEGLPNIYTGGTIVITDKMHHNINVTIPLDSDLTHVPPTRIAWRRFIENLQLFLERLNMPLLIFGTLLSLWASIIVTSAFNIVLLFVYIIFIVLKIIVDRKRFRSFGQVLDAKTRVPLDLAVVRIFNASTSMLVSTRITNQSAKFSALLVKGTYYLIVTKPPYLPKRTESITLTKAQALSIDILLEKPDDSVPNQQLPQMPPVVPQQQTPTEPQQPILPTVSKAESKPSKPEPVHPFVAPKLPSEHQQSSDQERAK